MGCHCAAAAALERAVWDEIARRAAITGSSSDDGAATAVEEETLRSIKLSVLLRVVDILKLPLSAADFVRRVDGVLGSRMVLSRETLAELDDAWSSILMTFSDNRISHSEKLVRENVLSKAPYFAERSDVVKFVNVLSLRDSVSVGGSGCERMKTNVLNTLLAVDGFAGCSPRDYKNYVDHLIDRGGRLRKRRPDSCGSKTERHVTATRAMYRYLDSIRDSNHRTGVGSLPLPLDGTLSVCLTFMTLSDLYDEMIGCRMDDTTRLCADKYNHFLSKKFDVKRTESAKIRKKLKKIYLKFFDSKHRRQQLEFVAFEKLSTLDKTYSQHVVL